LNRPSTFSIVGHDESTGELGIAVQSKFLAAGAVVPWAKADVGAVATQSAANTTYGPRGLDLLAKGKSPEAALETLVADDEEREIRQAGIVDANGNSAAFTGEECLNYAGHVSEKNFTCQGNILVSERTITDMADSFRKTDGQPLPERLVTALEAGDRAGGDRRGKQSAALLVVEEDGGYGGFNDRKIDLRVDDNERPIAKLADLLSLHRLYFSQPEEEDLVKLDKEVVLKIQRLLKELDYYSGPESGNYDDATRNALLEYCRVENLEEKLRGDEQFDVRILEFMKENAASQ
jgi:uncharacterized Ntn-hydrolase superfamily protein